MSSEVKKLKIGTLNCTSVYTLQRRHQLYHIIKRMKPDILLLQETWLKEVNILQIPRYESIRTDANGTYLGTAILIKNTFVWEQIHLPKVNFIETTAAVIDLQANMKVLIITIYIPANITTGDMDRELEAIREEAVKYDACIIGGDFNARDLSWDNGINIRGPHLQRWAAENSDLFTHLVPSEPTFPRSGSRIDHFIISNELVNNNTYLEVEPTFSTHNSVTLELHLRNGLIPMVQMPPLFRDFSGVNWIGFREDIERDLSRIDIAVDRNLSTKEIDQKVELLTSVVQSGMDKWIPKKEAISDGHLLLSPQVQRLIAHRRKLKKLLMRENSKTFKNLPRVAELVAAIRCWSEIIEKEIQKDIRERTTKFVSEIGDDRNMFQKINRFTGRKRRSKIKAINIDSQTSSNKDEITGAFATFYKGLYKEQIPDGDPELLKTIKQEQTAERSLLCRTSFNETNNAINPSEADFFSSPEEIQGIIRNLNNKKSAGPDDIPNRVIRKMPYVFCKLLTVIVNNCLNASYFPTKWKEATLIPIEKKKEAKEVTNFRPISMTNNLSKILEQVILTNLELEEDPIPPYQFGFRRSHSTMEALCLLRDNVAHAFNNRNTALTCFLDINKAFDSVWIEGLRHKLRGYDMDPHIVKIIGSFLQERSATVLVNKSRSLPIPIERGVPQGTKLGPRLYNLFTADQPTPRNDKMKILQYADDTAVIATARSPDSAATSLQSYIIELEEFYKKWGISVNGSKSELVLFRPRRKLRIRSTIKKARNICIKIGGEDLKPAKNVKYLGITFDEKLNFKQHIDITVNKAKKAYGMLVPVMKNAALSKKHKEIMYNMLIRPIVLYGALVWASSKPTSLEKIAIFERRIIRRITGLYRKNFKHYYSNVTLYNNCNVKPLHKYIKNYVYSQKKRFWRHENQLVQQAARTDYPNGPYLRTRNINKKYLKKFFEEKTLYIRG